MYYNVALKAELSFNVYESPHSFFRSNTIRQRQQKPTLDVILLHVYFFQERDEVGSTFSCAILGPSQNISS